MARSTDMEAGFTRHGNLAPEYSLELAFGGTVGANSLVTIAADGDVEEAGFNSTSVIGVNREDQSRSAADGLGPPKIGWGLVRLKAEYAINEGERLKAAASGRASPLVDSALSGTVIDNDATAGNFGNQPANDGVELISDSASDTQNATVWYTRNGQGDTVFSETVTLTGTSQVALTHTDVQLVLGVELSSAAVGTVTIREASANATITTITAGNTTAGVEDVDAGSTRAHNVAPTAVADGASTKQVGIIGTDENGDELFDSQALNGTTAVTFNDTFQTVTRVLVGDVATGTQATFSVGAEDDELLHVGKALEAASAQDDLFYALVFPK